MKHLLIILTTLMSTIIYSQDKPQLIYVGDPMCSWCYGFAPEISELRNEFKTQLNFKLILGGLRPYGTETMAELGDFLLHHWKDVNKKSGQPFNYEIIKDVSFIYDTEPACRAVIVARAMNPSIEFDFFKSVQDAFYVENKNTNEISTYILIAEKYDLDQTIFIQKFNAEKFKQATKTDFHLSAQYGISGFPATLILFKDKIHVLARGYATAEELSKRIHSIIKE